MFLVFIELLESVLLAVINFGENVGHYFFKYFLTPSLSLPTKRMLDF